MDFSDEKRNLKKIKKIKEFADGFFRWKNSDEKKQKQKNSGEKKNSFSDEKVQVDLKNQMKKLRWIQKIAKNQIHVVLILDNAN